MTAINKAVSVINDLQYSPTLKLHLVFAKYNRYAKMTQFKKACINKIKYGSNCKARINRAIGIISKDITLMAI